jgi:heptosyltransferase-2
VNVLIIKLGATGDVVRTTPLLRRLNGEVTWITAAANTVVLQGNGHHLRCLSWEEGEKALDLHYDLTINLEDTLHVAEFLRAVRCDELFGACCDANSSLHYTENSNRWFDLRSSVAQV